MKTEIRRARPEDAHAIHIAHMKSIQEVCSRDHSEEEIRAWGGRDFVEEQRLNAINNQFVFVALCDDHIEGFLHFNIDIEKKSAYVFALYLTQKANGQGFGKKLVQILFDECALKDVKQIDLHSTLTAHEFYLKLGFVDSGPMTTVQVNNVQVRCTPMHKNC